MFLCCPFPYPTDNSPSSLLYTAVFIPFDSLAQIKAFPAIPQAPRTPHELPSLRALIPG